MVKVRLFAVLRDGRVLGVEAEGKTAGEVADALSARFGERFGQIAAIGSLVVNGEGPRGRPGRRRRRGALLLPLRRRP